MKPRAARRGNAAPFKLLWALSVFVLWAGMASPAFAAKPARAGKPVKERLVLMPLRVGEENRNMQGAMETALVQGLQEKYEVFAGEDVAQKSRAIFQRESRAAKKDCDETRCMEDIAIAFQSELIATANVARVEGGYLLALSIRNVMDNKAVFSNSLPCKSCDAFQVVEKLKELSGAPVSGSPQNPSYPVDTAGSDTVSPEQQAWQEAESAGDEAGYQSYLDGYPHGSHADLARERLHKKSTAAPVSEDEQRLWQVAQDRHSISAVQAYLDKYPNGRYVEAANKRIKSLRDEEAANKQQAAGVPSAADRLKEAETADKAKETSRIKVLPQYLEKVIPELVKRKKDAD